MATRLRPCPSARFLAAYSLPDLSGTEPRALSSRDTRQVSFGSQGSGSRSTRSVSAAPPSTPSPAQIASTPLGVLRRC